MPNRKSGKQALFCFKMAAGLPLRVDYLHHVALFQLAVFWRWRFSLTSRSLAVPDEFNWMTVEICEVYWSSAPAVVELEILRHTEKSGLEPVLPIPVKKSSKNLHVLASILLGSFLSGGETCRSLL